MGYTFKSAIGHIEVYDKYGAFCFSADTMSEAKRELMDWNA